MTYNIKTGKEKKLERKKQGQSPDFKYQATLKDACFTYLWRIRMQAWSEALCLKHGGILAA